MCCLRGGTRKGTARAKVRKPPTADDADRHFVLAWIAV
jgi:hypothetical protein